MNMKTKTFLSLGECMVELSPTGTDSFKMGFAGDTFNTAWYARHFLRPDWKVSYGSCVGMDALSGKMLDFMETAQIDISTVRRMPDRTVGLYMIQLKDGERSFSYWREQSAARTLAQDEIWLKQVVGSADVIYFSGITLAILPDDGARTRFCQSLAAVRQAGKQVVFDTNMRPGLWPDVDAMRRGITLGASVADIVLPSFDEEAAHFGDDRLEKTASRYANAGAKLVIVKNGAGPLLIWEEETGAQQFAPVPVAHVVDTTAAGDSFNAGFLAAYLQGRPLTQAVRSGMELAARVVQAKGALVDP